MKNDPFDKTQDHAERSRMHEKFFAGFVIVVLFLFLVKLSYAASNYVLPYPSVMPGSRLYEISLIWDKFRKYWYFGDFGQFKYNLSESDKYLVEAKTLFEYKQYFLGLNALNKSKDYYDKSHPFLLKAQNKGKDMRGKLMLFKSASAKHIEILLKIKSEVPEEFTWMPEKSTPTKLHLHREIEESINIRRK